MRRYLMNILERGQYDWQTKMRVPLDDPEVASQTPIDDLFDLRNFGVACSYELVDWLHENGFTHFEVEKWHEFRASVGLSDPRKSGTPKNTSISIDGQHD
jgi:hypothetical protein